MIPDVPEERYAEEAVLGSCLIDPEALGLLDLGPFDFKFMAHQHIFSAMLNVRDAGHPADFVLVCAELERLGLMENIGGLGELTRLMTSVPTSLHVLHYADLVRRASTQRRTLSAASALALLAHEPPATTAALVAGARDILDRALSGVPTRKTGPVSISDALRDYLQQAESEPVAPGVVGAQTVPTGFLDLDRLIGGLVPGYLNVLAARPAVGKTSLAMNIIRNAAVRFNKRVLFFSVEMGIASVAERFLASEAVMDSTRLRSGKLTAEELRRLNDAYETLKVAQVWIDDERTVSIDELRRTADAYTVDLVVVDYLQLVKGPRADNRALEVGAVSTGLKTLARERDVPVLALAQLNRNVEHRSDGVPMLSDLRESGSVENDADVVMLMHQGGGDRKGLCDVIVAKNRNGAVGTATLSWLAPSTRFGDVVRA